MRFKFICRSILLIGILLSLLNGCEQREEAGVAGSTSSDMRLVEKKDRDDQSTLHTGQTEKTAKIETKRLLNEPVSLSIYEVPSQALLQWHQVQGAQPALLIYANNPMLVSVPSFKIKNLLQQLVAGNEDSLRVDIANPAVLPQMTLHAALEAGLFSAVYWVMPSKADIADLSLDVFRKQMMLINALSPDEAQTLTLQDGVFSGRVHGVPFYAVHPQAQFSISRPTVFHFDLSYLIPFYQGEIKTPVFSLLYNTLKHLRDRKFETVSASFSYSQMTREVALGSRFLAAVMKTLFEQPELLDQGVPKNWQQRANALYLPEMYLITETLNILMKMIKENPGDPSLQYALYKVSLESMKTYSSALSHLAEAVKGDNTYALEYLILASLAREQNRPDQATRMLRLAHEALPDNPFITLDYSRALIMEGKKEQAVPLLEALVEEPWSKTFYPDKPEIIRELLDRARTD